MASTGWSRDTVAVVTGANRGIGVEIVKQLAENGLTVVLTARDPTKGKAAAEELQAKGLKAVVFHQLDLTDAKSVDSFAAWLKSEYGGFDILITNAAVFSTSFDYESAVSVLGTNYYGVKRVNKALVPLLRPSPNGARIVNVSSRNGLYERLKSEKLKEIFRDEDHYSEAGADSLAEKYLADMKAGRTEEEGWIQNVEGLNPIYSDSKMILNLYSAALAKSLQGKEIFAAGMCPGVTLTDMLKTAIANGFKPPPGFPIKSVEEGAETAVWLALLPKAEWKGKTGKLFGENKEYPFGWENPPE